MTTNQLLFTATDSLMYETKKLNLNQLSLILLKVFQIDEVSIYPSYLISIECRVLHF